MDEPRRNHIIDRELRRAFAAGGGAAGGPHLDAEVAAAWVEHRLDTTEQQAIDTHLADCLDCQTMLATLARISPEDAPPSASVLSWWRTLRAGWLVPATAAAAAALIIWVAVPQQRSASTASTPAEQLQAREDRSAVATSATPAPAASASVPAAPAPAVQPKADTARRFAATGPELDKKTANLEQAPAAVAPSRDMRERLADAAPPPAPPEPPPAAPPESVIVNPPQPSRTQASGTVTVTGETPAPAPPLARQEAAAGASARALDSLASRAALAQSNALVIVAAGSAARWRRAGAAIEFAPRGDVPFTAATLPVAADAISAGSSPGGTVCWLTGRGGVVLVATDGLRFTRVTAPASIDLIAITATDARTATVVATDGRRYRTTNQGASWTAQ